MTNIAFVSLVNNNLLFNNCQKSLHLGMNFHPQWISVEPNRYGWNASQGLNYGIERLSADWVVCVHQDVLFPPDFFSRLSLALTQLPSDVALAGIVGCERTGRFSGHIVDPNGHCYWPPLPNPVLTLDEVLIAVRKETCLRFNPELPGFHCYGADICLQADSLGFKVAVIDAPLLHLSTGKLDQSYLDASQWLMKKWGARYGYVIPTPATLLQDSRAKIFYRYLHRYNRRKARLSRNNNICSNLRCAAHELLHSIQAEEM